MDILFLDTSIWESNNFLESKRIKQLLKLSKDDQIRIVLPKLTYDEILNRIKKNTEDACSKVKKHRNDVRILRNIPELEDRFIEIDKESATEKLQQIFAQTLKDSNVEIIDYPTVNIQQIFSSYFEKKFPFGSKGKKDEFPDAFALVSIEKWASDEDEIVITFAKDNDILGYESDMLKVNENFETYISDKLIEIDDTNIEFLETSFSDEESNLKSEVEYWVRNQLDDYSKYYDISNFMEIHDIEVLKVGVEFVDRAITSVEEDFITFQSTTIISYEVLINMDDENYMIKDDDTKSWLSYETRNEILKQEREIVVDFRYDIMPIEEGPGLIAIEIINEEQTLRV